MYTTITLLNENWKQITTKKKNNFLKLVLKICEGQVCFFKPTLLGTLKPLFFIGLALPCLTKPSEERQHQQHHHHIHYSEIYKTVFSRFFLCSYLGLALPWASRSTVGTPNLTNRVKRDCSILENFWKAMFLMTGGSWWWSPIMIHRFNRLKPSSGFWNVKHRVEYAIYVLSSNSFTLVGQFTEE